MEHVVVSQMMKHFDEHGILADCQHGFRKQRSCETQLIGLTQELHERLEEKVQVDMIVLDFSKAFDKVPHQRLMTKLWNYGIRGNTHAWIKSFLLGRTQRVVVDGEGSGWYQWSQAYRRAQYSARCSSFPPSMTSQKLLNQMCASSLMTA